MRKLILTYNLEPAGSHGVWGLDDHFFLPYIFGSAQLTRAITDNEPMPQEGSVQGAPKPSAITKAELVEHYRESNMYFSAIAFINDVKKGPFWEHSPLLYDISGIKDGWGKINKGMIKMFNAEVLAKFPVVQHFHFGSLYSWDLDPEASAAPTSVHVASRSAAEARPAAPQPGVGTAAPWAQPATRTPGPAGPGTAFPPTRAPWADSSRPGTVTPRPMPPVPKGGIPNTGPPPPTSFPRGTPGTASNQFSVTKAPWAKD